MCFHARSNRTRQRIHRLQLQVTCVAGSWQPGLAKAGQQLVVIANRRRASQRCNCKRRLAQACVDAPSSPSVYLTTSQVPALNIFETSFRRGKFDESRKLANGSLMDFAHIYPMDAVFDTPEDVPEEVRSLIFLSSCNACTRRGAQKGWVYISTPCTRCLTPLRTCSRS